MTREWCLKIWGVRGSFPKPTAETQLFGGNTSCISAVFDRTAILLDAGSGITGFAQSLRKEQAGNRLNILISHLHLDHVIGLFNFSPLQDPDLDIHFYGGAGLQTGLESLLREPFWPVSLSDFPAKITFHEFAPGTSFQIDEVQVDTMAANHPNGCLLYRLTSGGIKWVHALDCELDRAIAPKIEEFSRDSDLLVWDADYTSRDLHRGWGHSTWEQGIAMRRACGAKKVLMTHYNWNYTDKYLIQLEQDAAKQDSACLFAREGMELRL